MIKKLFILLLSCVLLVPACVSTAEKIETKPIAVSDTDSSIQYNILTKGSEQGVPCSSNIFLTVQINFDQPDGSIKTVFFQPNVYLIRYYYYVNRDNTGQYTGGYVVLSSTYPMFQNVSNFAYSLNLSYTKINNPTLTSVIGHNTYYEVTIAGGLYQITYNSVINVDVNGNVKSTQSQTVSGSYYYHFSGTL